MCATTLVRADASRIRLEIQGENTLPRNAHVAVPILLELTVDSAAPLLLTPSIEGSVVEVVRGRLLRSDAKALDETHLRFEVPVVARSEGTAILRIEVVSYVCEPRCRRVTTTASRALHVR